MKMGAGGAPAGKERTMVRMLVVVQTAISLGIGEQVFLTGAADELGRWNVAAVPMTRSRNGANSICRAHVASPPDSRV